jgi:multidrug resistance efflux pump
MVLSRSCRRLAAVMALALMSSIGASSIARGQSTADDNSKLVTAYTAPSVRTKMSFRVSGIVREIPVKNGDKVKAGDLLIQQDDRVERKQWESLDLQSKSNAQIEAAEAELKVAQLDLKRLKGMKNLEVANDNEVEKAELNVAVAQKKIEVAKEEKASKGLEAEAKAAVVDQMRMTVPKDLIEAEVEKVESQLGELADYQKPSIILVKNDPLWVMVNLPNDVAMKLKKGDVLEVRYDHAAAGGKPKFADSEPWQKATVDFLSPMADASSFKRLVQLSMPNPTLMASGYKVAVRLPESVVTAEAK